MSARKKTVTTEAEPIKAVMIDEPAEEVTEAQAAEEPAEEPKEAVVYLGPSIGKFINHGAVFEGGVIPAYLEEKAREIPAIKGLIVPVSRYAEVAEKITLPEGRFRTLYDLIASKAN